MKKFSGIIFSWASISLIWLFWAIIAIVKEFSTEIVLLSLTLSLLAHIAGKLETRKSPTDIGETAQIIHDSILEGGWCLSYESIYKDDIKVVLPDNKFLGMKIIIDDTSYIINDREKLYIIDAISRTEKFK